jgi:hypothetical protein
VLRFWEITSISNRLASEFDFLKNRILSEEFTDGHCDPKFGEAWQEDFEWERSGRFLPHDSQLN